MRGRKRWHVCGHSYCSDYAVSPGLTGFGYSGPDHNEALITEQLPRRNRLAFTSHGQPSPLGNIVAISYDCGIPVGRDYDFGAPAAVPCQ
jgi:hypothetical protein